MQSNVFYVMAAGYAQKNADVRQSAWTAWDVILIRPYVPAAVTAKMYVSEMPSIFMWVRYEIYHMRVRESSNGVSCGYSGTHCQA